jgi:thiol:disulfide interchange protein
MNRSSIRAQCWLAILPGALALLTSFALAAARAGEKPGIDWQPWSDKVFAQAAAEHKFVLLDLGAGWCHWCHVMDQLTYSDPEVIKLLREKYIAVRVDQDARPDLANRYEDYGWPATIVFNADRGEIVKRQRIHSAEADGVTVASDYR